MYYYIIFTYIMILKYAEKVSESKYSKMLNGFINSGNIIRD